MLSREIAFFWYQNENVVKKDDQYVDQANDAGLTDAR